MARTIGVYVTAMCTFCFLLEYALGVQRARLNEGYIERIEHHSRQKRNVDCEKRYQTITAGHTRCLQPAGQAKDLGGVSIADQGFIVDIHNKVRGEVNPPATNMIKMSWDEELAKTATRWAFYCSIQHDRSYKRYEFGRFSVGQNLAWGSYQMGWETAISLWADEIKDFTYGGPNNLAAVGHYTQMVWADTVKVGCGHALCGNTYYYVCNYGPAGNLNIDVPYNRGTTCSKCPGRCRENLCDCGSKVCLNGGKIDLNTCECQCEQSFHVQPNCGLNCTNIEKKEPRYCSQFGVGGCSVYSNVPQECPSMCGWCPEADYRELKPSTSDVNPSSSEKTCVSLTAFFLVLFLHILVT